MYRNFFEEERRNDNVLHSYIFNKKYKNMVVDTDNIPISALDYEGMRSMKNGSQRATSKGVPTSHNTNLNSARKQQ